MIPSLKLSGSDQNHQEKSQWADGDDGKDNQELAEKVLKKSLDYFQRSTEIFHIRSITSATLHNNSNKRTSIFSIDLDSSSSSSSRPSFHNLPSNTQPIRFISDPENLIESNQPLSPITQPVIQLLPQQLKTGQQPHNP
ncbi:hypothetical protein BY996DRAFT_6586808 [Phakopsora pachyrhizi]|uniref:Uncharacterized protein n=1 Tax=Phakopsora pachyrhizi TaxID=170000 RepID=A0AAV0AJ41_PHAPC|nr:hypothetical protein BY996DRAFT_6586808 [Phakopsora pachyrhizi]CAH7668257.1 hypothetical protein PPACK8108_LOCUS2740 [Phakopsora pachyrhizi]